MCFFFFFWFNGYYMKVVTTDDEVHWRCKWFMYGHQTKRLRWWATVSCVDSRALFTTWTLPNYLHIYFHCYSDGIIIVQMFANPLGFDFNRTLFYLIPHIKRNTYCKVLRVIYNLEFSLLDFLKCEFAHHYEVCFGSRRNFNKQLCIPNSIRIVFIVRLHTHWIKLYACISMQPYNMQYVIFMYFIGIFGLNGSIYESNPLKQQASLMDLWPSDRSGMYFSPFIWLLLWQNI